MHASIHAANPFGMLTDPESLLNAIEQSERLKGLHSRVCRPLDRPAASRREADELARYDAMVDDSAVEPDGE
ncbi:MAG TPA: hypothetical protein VFQ16_08610 [Burkholderiaceae bacterium]|nr:hypothetical protein [Burkholderiaceae bacterium]